VMARVNHCNVQMIRRCSADVKCRYLNNDKSRLSVNVSVSVIMSVRLELFSDSEYSDIPLQATGSGV
jgi:hypothetical protein